jgi:small subunit ribosomal protein S25e
MGGTKKKSLASMEKQQDSEADQKGEDQKGKKAKDQKGPQQQKRLPFLMPKSSDDELLKSLSPLRAITVYSACRALGVNASIAKSVLVGLEQRNRLKRVGGFSGHHVWAAPPKS